MNHLIIVIVATSMLTKFIFWIIKQWRKNKND